MKRNIVLVLLAAFVIVEFNSCSKVANAIAQALTWQGVDVTITVLAVSDTTLHQNMGTGSFSYNLDSFIKAKTGNLLGIKNIDTFRFNSCTLTIQNPDSNNNFQNFQSAMGSFSTLTNTTPVSMGEVDNNPNVYATTLSLPVNTTTNLRSYVPNSGTMVINYTYGGKLRKPTTTTLTINAHIDYYIHVTP